MKSLVAGIVVILVIGIGGFVYRNVSERTGSEPVACTEEAKVCPDGTAVGRQGPSCAFAPCAFPNVEVPGASIAFALPDGYAADENAGGAEPTLLGAFVKPSLAGDPPHTIIVRAYPIPAGESAEDVILANTRRLTADMPVESMDDFAPMFVNGKTFQFFVADRFEAQVVSYFYLPRSGDVLRFEVVERDVTEWMEPELVVTDLPEHKELLELLGTLQTP